MAAGAPPAVIYHEPNANSLFPYTIIQPRIGITSSFTPVADIASSSNSPSACATNNDPSTSYNAVVTSPSASPSSSASTPTNITIPVYKASATFPNAQNPHRIRFSVYIVCIHTEEEPPTNMIQWFIPQDNQSLAGVMYPPFTTHDGFFCVIFPHMNLGSVKSVMANHFPKGIPEMGVLVVLRQALNQLREIHRKGFRHCQICTAHIYVSDGPEIRMGFSISIYHLDDDFDQGPDGSAAASYFWAAAPEIYGVDTPEYTEKTDVWSIGFTALEMVYGGFEEINRGHLAYVLEKMRRKRKISGRSIVMRNVTAGTGVEKQPWKKRFGEMLGKLNPKKKKNEYTKEVSKEFERMVLRYLAETPNHRPTVAGLLHMRIFRELQRNVTDFQALINQQHVIQDH